MLMLTRHWYHASKLHPLTLALLPFSWLFAGITRLRRWLYQSRLLQQINFNVVVIVVGNITVGGTGKTPLVIWLAQFLKSHGLRPGIVSRGYGALYSHNKPYWVETEDSAAKVSDEALLIRRHTKCPVVICKDKALAASALLADKACDIIICDDGLQHYRLGRDIEIALIDGTRNFGNACLLPAGPLRESPSRLRTVDFVITNKNTQKSSQHNEIYLAPIAYVNLNDVNQCIAIDAFNKPIVHAVAAVGNPERFFDTLRQLGLQIIEHIFPDHHLFTARDIQFTDGFPIVMTEKDALKCEGIANDNCWYLQVEFVIAPQLSHAIYSKIIAQCKHKEASNDEENTYQHGFSDVYAGKYSRKNPKSFATERSEK